MICPSKICKEEIPDDSLYCDQCGIQILRCSKCGNPGTGRFCGKCGGEMAFPKSDNATLKPPSFLEDEKTQNQTVAQTAKPVSSSTIIIPLQGKKVLFCHQDGWVMEVADGDILGRTSGNHTDKLGAFPVISGTHARVTFENNAWYITDQKSTNKTYVGSILAVPGAPVRIKTNDVVQLANVKFTVREA